MARLSIIPARAVCDENLSDTQVRVLCAIGTFTNKLGGNVWASVRTLATQSNLSERTVQRSLPALVKYGYLRRQEREGRTTLYEVVLESPTVTPDGGRGDSADGGGVTAESPEGCTTRTTQQNPKRKKESDHPSAEEEEVLHHLWHNFPKRDQPHLYVPARKAIVGLLRQGVPRGDMVGAMVAYHDHLLREKTQPKYVKSLHGFYSDDYWRSFLTVRVYGRTRDEWARSGQDVAEFDRLAALAIAE